MTQNDANVHKALLDIKSIAIVGAKDTPGQPVDRVGRYLIEHGHTVIPVHPVRENVWGLPACKSIAELAKNASSKGQQVDAIVLFRAPEYCAGHAEECLNLSPLPKVFWMQLGITSNEARKIMEKAGVFVVEDACIMVEYKRLQA